MRTFKLGNNHNGYVIIVDNIDYIEYRVREIKIMLKSGLSINILTPVSYNRLSNQETIDYCESVYLDTLKLISHIENGGK